MGQYYIVPRVGQSGFISPIHQNMEMYWDKIQSIPIFFQKDLKIVIQSITLLLQNDLKIVLQSITLLLLNYFKIVIQSITKSFKIYYNLTDVFVYTK